MPILNFLSNFVPFFNKSNNCLSVDVESSPFSKTKFKESVMYVPTECQNFFVKFCGYSVITWSFAIFEGI